MSAQSEALRLADALGMSSNHGIRREAAAELRRLHAELEREQMRLAACGVVALADTPNSAKHVRQMHSDYESASCQEVARRVDECISLRAQRDALLEALRGLLALDKEHHQRGHDDEDICQEVQAAYAAIAKAEENT